MVKKVKKKTKKSVKKRAKRRDRRKEPKKVSRKKVKGRINVRDRSPDALEPLNRLGRSTMLNDEMLAKIILMWRYGITNEKIAHIVGISLRSLQQWVKDNRVVDVTIIDDPLLKRHRKVRMGLGDVMKHERDNLKASYIERLERLIDMSQEEGDLKTASHNLRWVMEKMLPHVFGDPKFRPEGDPNEPKKVGYPLTPPLD